MADSKLSKTAKGELLARLVLAPVVHPFAEKRRLERNFARWAAELVPVPKGNERPVGISMDAFGERAVEVYRLCYERSQSRSEREKVVSDFVAHFPHLIFDAKWLQKLVRNSCFHGDLIDPDAGKLISSMAKGFDRADRRKRSKRGLGVLRLEAAAIVRVRVHKELVAWDKTVERELQPDSEWIRDLAVKKTRELIRENPLRLKPIEKRLQQLLQKGYLYDASILIAATVFNVRQRALQQKLV